MGTSPRLIRLRRPPVLAMQEGVYLPEVASKQLEAAEEVWAEYRKAHRRAYDGRICHVLGVHRNGHGGATIHAIDCAYRFYAVQDEGCDLGVRPLGVKGVVIRGDKVLVGLRSPEVRAYSGQWEFVPGGMVEPGSDPAATVARELWEETGFKPATLPQAVAILYDAVARTWEIVFRIAEPVGAELVCSSEHDQLEWISIDSIPTLQNVSAVTDDLALLVQTSALGVAAPTAEQPPDGR